jgi:hypothetical protein
MREGARSGVGLAERICDITYPISSSPSYTEDIHTTITLVLLFLKLSLGSNFSIQSLDTESNESKS